MAANKGLGKGLGALLGESAMQPSTQQSPLLLPLQKIEPNRLQPRKSFNEEELAALADSIRQHGVIQPLTVRLLDTGYYQIIAGERRWRAARMAGLREVPVVIIEADDKKAMELALIENLQRADLTPIEEARGYQQLIGEYGLTQEQVADRVSKSRPAVANAMRLIGQAHRRTRKSASFHQGRAPAAGRGAESRQFAAFRPADGGHVQKASEGRAKAGAEARRGRLSCRVRKDAHALPWPRGQDCRRQAQGQN